uniref:Uncharacterized protein n=1 Tax=Nelumbo nucifera TaxID=4432 RepID=A0A822YJF3_NELNU|nr:TPA_asm: hypothetical protein HUJ06_011498 [Nelumbo nucifera]
MVPTELGRKFLGGKGNWFSTKCVGIDEAVYLYGDLGSELLVWREVAEKVAETEIVALLLDRHLRKSNDVGFIFNSVLTGFLQQDMRNNNSHRSNNSEVASHELQPLKIFHRISFQNSYTNFRESNVLECR